MATGVTANTAGSADNQYFYEDLIFRIDKKGRVKFGLVLENSENFSSDEEDDFDDILSKGEIRVAWHPDGKEDVLNEQQVGLADRTLMPGDVVRRLVHGKDTQRGYCREINMKADLKVIGTKYVLKNVMAERLKPLAKVSRDNAVCLDSWVGSTKSVDEKIIIKSSCGAIMEVSDLDMCPFIDRNTKFRSGFFSETVYYPGQVVTGKLENLDNVKLLAPSINLKTDKKGKPLARKFTVQSVQAEGVWVHWQCKALSENNCDDLKANMLVQPKAYVTGEDLTRLKYLNLFESCMLQINDKNYLKITDCDVLVKKSQWDKEQAIKYKLLLSQQQKDDNYQIRNKSTKVSSKGGDKIKIKFSSTNTLEVELKKQLLSSKPSKISCTTIPKNVVVSTNITNVSENFEKSNVSTNKNERNETELSNMQPSVTITNENEEQLIIKNIDDSKLKPNSEVILTDDWQTDEDGEDLDDNSEFSDSTATTISTCSSPTPKSSPKRSPLLRKKQLKKLKKSASVSNEKIPAVGDDVVTEALIVYSTATVVWQDGTVETDIPSTHLYPIHHLDDHEFFPGDFVLSGIEGADVSFRDYGVIQTVDHQGRTAHVKWFTTYTSADEPRPTYKGESEVSVYDLKDHPDFQYRPGTIVIRVANFVGEDATCTAGQIIDNFVDGRVKVWWVDNHISMCWPQDLFEVGQYDADNNFWGNNESENDSWETESEVSEPGGSPQKGISEPLLAVNLERARVSMSRLEEIFSINPSLQNQEVMRKLLAVYKKCRYLDRLMNTTFFHEDHFMGLLERVRKGGTQTTAERAQDQKNRLFNPSPNTKQNLSTNLATNEIVENCSRKESAFFLSREYAPKVILNLSSTQFKYSSSKKKVITRDLTEPSSTNFAVIERQNSSSSVGICATSSNGTINSSPISNCQSNTELVVANASRVNLQGNHCCSIVTTNSTDTKNMYSNEKNKLLSSVMSHIEKATQETEKSNQLKLSTASTSQDDSGNYSRNEFCDGSSTSYASSSDLTADVNNSLLKANDDQKSISCSSIELTDDSPEHVCARLCTLLKGQLIKAVQEIQQKYCKTVFNLSDVVEYSFPEDIEISGEKTTENSDDNVKDNFSILSPSLKTLENFDIDDEITNTETESQNVNNKLTSTPVTPSSNTVPEVSTPISLAVPLECFQIMESAPSTHKYHLTIFHPNAPQQYYKAVRKEHKLLRTSLPPGVWVRVFEDRMDLVSVMIEGPKNTPYEDGMFFFDIQLGRDYPKSPPQCHYISYCSDRLNPNLYEDGKVCVSLLGTWAGRDSEVWTSNSTLLQVIVSIQGLILVSEPYFNEAGYEKQKGTQQGKENSRMYNEMVIIKLVQSMTKLLAQPPEIFREQIYEHFKDCGKRMHKRIKSWMNFSTQSIQTPLCEDTEHSSSQPEFPLVPASRGFCLTLAGLLDIFLRKIELITTSTNFE